MEALDDTPADLDRDVEDKPGILDNPDKLAVGDILPEDLLVNVIID